MPPSQTRMDIFRDDVTAPFEAARFAIEGRLPVQVGRLRAKHFEGVRRPCCLDMLIKMPGDDLRLPDMFDGDAAIQGLLNQALAFEDRVLPGWRETRFLYLTVDNREVDVGRTHRNRGWHFDGMQGARYPNKLAACHQFVAADRLTTEFSGQTTDAAHLDEMRHNWFEELGRQVPDDAPVHRAEPLEIVAMSAYQLHRSPIARVSAWRTFLRLDVSLKRQDRLGNTLNPRLPAPWTFVPRSLPEGLEHTISDAGWDGAKALSNVA